MDPSATALIVGLRSPSYLGGDASALSECGDEFLAYAVGAANPVEEMGLQNSRDALGGRSKQDTEGWVRTDEEVLQRT